MRICAIILAAGKGSRMNDMNVPKVLRQVGGKSMLERVVMTAKQLTDDVIVVVSEENEKDIQNLNLDVKYCIQKNLDGTASAVLAAENEYIDKDILVLLGDVPLLKAETLSQIVTSGKDCVILGFRMQEENKFGRLVLVENKENKEDKIVERIVEYNEANEEERKIETVNSGILFLKSNHTSKLREIKNENSKKEYYLTDIVEIINRESVVSYIEADKKECMGANSPADLKILESLL